jgi:hypothetical protein
MLARVIGFFIIQVKVKFFATLLPNIERLLITQVGFATRLKCSGLPVRDNDRFRDVIKDRL